MGTAISLAASYLILIAFAVWAFKRTVAWKASKEFDQKFRAAMTDFVKELDAPWSAQDVVGVWAKVYGAKFSDEELDGLIRWYTSPLGRKDTDANQTALREFTSHFSELSKPIVQRETQKLIERLRKIATECNCRAMADAT